MGIQVEDPYVRIRQLETALESRVVIEQATGTLSERFHLSIGEAFELLRSSARSSRKPLHELAATVVSQRDVTPPEIAATLAESGRR